MAKGNASNGNGPQVQRREAWVDLPEEYAGFKVQVWVNAPTKLFMALRGEDMTEEQLQETASKLVLAHNGWRDFDGNEYPPPSEEAFWVEIPTELAACVFALLQAESFKLPNSLAPKSRRSRRG